MDASHSYNKPVIVQAPDLPVLPSRTWQLLKTSTHLPAISAAPTYALPWAIPKAE